MKLDTRKFALLLLFAALLPHACSSKDECQPGIEGCSCLDGKCLEGLACFSELCVDAGMGTSGTSGSGEPPLFSEQGTWALTLFDLDGSGLTPFDVAARADKFLLHYDSDAAVVSAASCLDSMGRTDITETLCDTDTFQCRCFNYTFEGTSMTWTEFISDGFIAPPEPADPSVPKSGDPHVIKVEPFPESAQTLIYSPMPYSLFNSDGKTTRHVFQVRGDSQFAATGCMDACGA